MSRFSKDAQIVILRQAPLNSEQLRDAFCVGDSMLWWRAVTERIQFFIDVSQDNARSACGDNNPMATSAAVGAVDVLKDLLADFEKRRQDATKNQ